MNGVSTMISNGNLSGAARSMAAAAGSTVNALAVSSPLLKSVSQTGAARVAEATAREKEDVYKRQHEPLRLEY